jgi:hypothetical protein
MKIIFLDVDGVLNSSDSEDHFHCFIGLDYSGIKLLREIVDTTGAEIVLVSTWKLSWDKDGSRPDSLGAYLDARLAEEGLTILDKTGGNMNERGHGIIDWLSEHLTESWIVLDDEIFEDYEECGIMPHLVKTSFYDGGLKEKHVEMAINLLNKGVMTYQTLD